jgi:hypothetical protein
VGKSVVDPRAARIIGIGQLDAGRQGRGDDVTVSAQPAMWAVMDTLAQGFGDVRPARAMLAHGGNNHSQLRVN